MNASILSPSGRPLPAIVALRAFAAVLIVWHHFALYPPLRDWAAPLFGDVLDWLEIHARSTQVFFVVGGFVMAGSMERRHWDVRRYRRFLVQRYCRIGLPYLAIAAAMVPLYSWARLWLPESVTGLPVSWPQALAHVFFLQDLLGYESLSAGFWFVCINFQLAGVYAAGLLLRDTLGRGRWDVVGGFGWPLALLSLFHFNLDEGWSHWWIYFFPYFFLGIVVRRGLDTRRGWQEGLLLMAAFGIAMALAWRWRLLSAALVGALLWGAARWGLGLNALGAWRPVAWLGRISFSLFLVHFPVLVVVATLWNRWDLNSPQGGAVGLLVAFGASLLVAELFHRAIERPAAMLGRGKPLPRQDNGRSAQPA